MTHYLWPVIVASSLALSACGTVPNGESKTPSSSRTGQLELALASGTYRCEQNVRIQVRRELLAGVNSRIDIDWNGNSHRLERDPSYSGLPRFADAASGLVWIDLPWKSLLLDGKTNKPLVNECRPT
ncbi:hypothetical protein [Dechloromonas denitrificans]|uniref:hypothetical protein n=1 Tax=Azonexaceae TaxID=2008795 RepID=UPI001CFBE7D0|nr:hypothetical protein [Dechloromonas denitrificans]UCV08982.1 MliC family protein [Dechloromonas denitrificans]